MSAKRTKRVNRSRLLNIFLSTIMVVEIVLMWQKISTELYYTYTVAAEKKEVDMINAELENTLNKLESEKERLSDEEYIKVYARGEFHLVKEGEQVFLLPRIGGSEDPSTDEN